MGDKFFESGVGLLLLKKIGKETCVSESLLLIVDLQIRKYTAKEQLFMSSVVWKEMTWNFMKLITVKF